MSDMSEPPRSQFGVGFFDHPTRSVHHPKYGVDIPVDVKIARLIATLWERGYETLMSCQDADELGAVIELDSVESVECLLDELLSVARRGGPRSLFSRLECAGNRESDGIYYEGDWGYDVGSRSVLLSFPAGDVRQVTRLAKQLPCRESRS